MSTRLTTPASWAVARHPMASMRTPSPKASEPPMANPIEVKAMAFDRFFSNQWTTATVIVRNPPRLDPRAMSR